MLYCYYDVDYADHFDELFGDQYASYFEPGFPKEIRELETAASQLNYIGKRALTHDSGFYRGFFNIVKSITTGPKAPVKRMFITGVSPVTLDDVTSGFNIGTNITTNHSFNEMVGFSEPELLLRSL